MSTKLSPRQYAFVMEYIADGNAGQAYVRAGYSAKNQDTANSAASELLRNPKVAALLEVEQQLKASRARITIDGIISRLDDVAAKAVSARQYGAAVRALELLGKHIGMWRNDDTAGPAQVYAQFNIYFAQWVAAGMKPDMEKALSVLPADVDLKAFGLVK